MEYERVNSKNEPIIVKGRTVQTYELTKTINLELPDFNQVLSVMSTKSNMSNTSIMSNTTNDVESSHKGVGMDVKDVIDMRKQDIKSALNKKISEFLLEPNNKKNPDQERVALVGSNHFECSVLEIQQVQRELGLIPSEEEEVGR